MTRIETNEARHTACLPSDDAERDKGYDRVMSGRCAALLGGAIVAFAVAEREANACICNGASTLLAPTTAEHPTGASLVFATECSGALDAWKVTIDGKLALFVGKSHWLGVQAVGLDPAPTEGAEVVVTQSCKYDVEAEGCVVEDDVVERARFTVVGPDLVAPAVADEVAIEVEHGLFGESCDEPEHDLRFAATIRFPSSEQDAWAQIVFWSDGLEERSEAYEIPASGEITTQLIGDAVDYSGREVCVEAMAFDASGNASDWRSDCIVFDPQPIQTVNECALGTDERRGSGVLFLLLLSSRRRRR